MASETELFEPESWAPAPAESHHFAVNASAKIPRTYYDAQVHDPRLLPRALSKTYAQEIKRQLPRGVKVDVVSSTTSLTHGWDYTNFTKLHVYRDGMQPIEVGISLHVTEDKEYSGVVLVGAPYSNTIPAGRTADAERAIQYLTEAVASYLRGTGALRYPDEHPAPMHLPNASAQLMPALEHREVGPYSRTGAAEERARLLRTEGAHGVGVQQRGEDAYVGYVQQAQLPNAASLPPDHVRRVLEEAASRSFHPEVRRAILADEDGRWSNAVHEAWEQTLRLGGVEGYSQAQIDHLLADDVRYAAKSTLRGYAANAHRREDADEAAATELELYVENENGLSPGSTHGQGKSIRENLLKKMRAGTYDSELAWKGWLHVVETGAKQYAKEFGTAREWAQTFSPATRELAARSLAESFEAAVAAGEYE